MLTLQEPPRLVQEIDCTDIHPFKTILEATTFQQLKGKDYMIIKEQGQQLWYVMPNVDGLLVGGCFEED